MQGFDNMAGQPPQQAPGPQAPGGQDPLESMNLEKPQKEIIKAFYLKSTEVLVNEKFLPAAEKMLQQFPSVEEAMAQIASTIVMRVYAQAREEGQDIPLELVVIAGALFMEEVGEFAMAAGKKIGPETIEDAFYRAADLFREMLERQGVVTDADLQDGYEALRQEYGDDTFEMLAKKSKGIMQSNLTGMGAGQ